MSRILLSGASGFIGQALALQLTEDGHEVHGLYEHAESKAKNPTIPGHRKWVADLTDHERVKLLVQKVRPEIVLHLASRSEVALSFNNPIEVSRVNYLAVVNLAEACRQFAPLKAFVMASTMETYGNAHTFTGELAFTEDTPQYPMAPYAVAKLACEKYLAYMGYAYDFPYIVLRQTNTYGRRDNSFFIVERIVSQMLAGSVCNLGVGWPVRNFIFIDDLVAFYRVLLDRLPVGETFVTGPDRPVTIAGLVDLVRWRVGWDGVVNWGTVPVRAAEVPWLNSHAGKAWRLLGWEAKVGLEEGLDRTVAIWEQAPQADAEPKWAALR